MQVVWVSGFFSGGLIQLLILNIDIGLPIPFVSFQRGADMLKVSKRTLLLVAGIVWLIAGGNIAWLGIRSFAQMDQGIWWLLVIGAVVVFTLFHVKVFSKMVGKHAIRIAGYEAERIGIWHFFDVPS